MTHNPERRWPIFTIGYERAPLAQVTTALNNAGVDLLIDVRAVAASRRAGSSKTVLAASLREAGFDYLHLRDLGTPKAGRDAARAGRCEEMRTIFSGHWSSQPPFKPLSACRRSPPNGAPASYATKRIRTAATAKYSPNGSLSVCPCKWSICSPQQRERPSRLSWAWLTKAQA